MLSAPGLDATVVASCSLKRVDLSKSLSFPLRVVNKWFDDFAAKVGTQAARAWFFTVCVVIVLVWVPTMFLMNFDTSQLLISTVTTIITFLLVALLQNTQDRSVRAMQHKLDAILEATAQILDQTDGVDESGKLALHLRDMAGIEMESQDVPQEKLS